MVLYGAKIRVSGELAQVLLVGGLLAIVAAVLCNLVSWVVNGVMLKDLNKEERKSHKLQKVVLFVNALIVIAAIVVFVLDYTGQFTAVSDLVNQYL